MKSGYVAIIGRPNSGKSTLLNNILGQKVSITSPKPQTTRLPVQAVYEDDRGQIIFVDTPGIFGKVHDPIAAKINPVAESVLSQNIAVAVYLVDHTRDRNVEENKILGVLRKYRGKKILAYNKSDIRTPSYLPHYKFMETDFDAIYTISGLTRSNVNRLIEGVFELLPEGERLVEDSVRASPALNLDAKTFIAEIIREKATLFLRKEVPYSVTTVVDEIVNRSETKAYIKARIITTDDKYKRMIIGEGGRMIREIGMAARKELQTATNRSIFIDLTVEVNPHWFEQLI
jgi:GTPase